MTPEPRRFLTEQVRSLQLRLGHGRVDPMTAATEACRLFSEGAETVRARWLTLELQGYGDLVDPRPLHVILGVPSNDRLAAHVATYRTQPGFNESGAEFKHFFVEPLRELIATSARVATSGDASSIELVFAPAPGPSNHPRAGTFGRDVFERVVAGFVAALHLQLGAIAA